MIVTFLLVNTPDKEVTLLMLSSSPESQEKEIAPISQKGPPKGDACQSEGFLLTCIKLGRRRAYQLPRVSTARSTHVVLMFTKNKGNIFDHK